jgi:mobilome CxxCx(11)CxxC protein
MTQPSGQGSRSAWDLARDSFGAARIFERRCKALGRKLRLLSFFGLVGPLLVGTIHGAFGSYPIVVDWGTGLIGVAVAVVSLWSLTSRWDTALAYASQSQLDNYRLAREFGDLAKQLAAAPGTFAVTEAALRTQFRAREDQDNQQEVSEGEKRMGYRAALQQLQQACGACGKVPQGMAPTDCSSCGNFSKRLTI